jgi:hypothetical protein
MTVLEFLRGAAVIGIPGSGVFELDASGVVVDGQLVQSRLKSRLNLGRSCAELVPA